MRIAVFSKGFIVVKEQDKSFLFSVPQGTQQVLKANGIEVPPIVFTSCLKSPGYGELGKEVVHFREEGHNLPEIQITPILKKHGTDYSIVTKEAKVLFSERGDVSAQDVEGYDLAIIKNKHRSDKFDNKVITWPWIDQEFIVKEHTMTPVDEKLKVWSDMSEAPDNLKTIDGAKLSLDQMNLLARVAKGAAQNGKEDWAIAISTFKKGHVKKGKVWVEKTNKKEKNMDMEMKLSPEAAGYDKKGGDGVKACANCEYYLTNLTCCKVEGPISPNGICNIWEWEEPEKEDDSEEISSEMPTAMGMAMENYMETLTDSNGRVADDYLVVEDPKKVTTWHLAVSNKGKIDYGLMGNAAAALAAPGGFEGNKYEGPNKEKAIKKLIALYKKEERDLPENLAKASGISTKRKDYVDGKPIPRVIDILTANLHKAYNDTSDYLFKLGYINQDERMKIAGSIGDGLDAFRRNLENEEFAERPVDKYDVEFASQIKSVVEVYKDEKGQDRWASISSIATWDKQKELFSTKAMDWALGFSRLTGYKGPLRYKHIPGLDGGDCDTQYRVGDFLFESGTFRNNKIGVQMKEQLSSGEPWQISVGLLFAKDDIADGVYQRAAIFERSMTQRPALPMSVIIQKNKQELEMKILTEAELKAAADELKMDLTEVKTMYERALAAGTPFADKDAFKEALKTEEETVDEPQTEEEVVEEYTAEQMKEIVANLSEEEFKQLENLLSEVKEKKMPPWLQKPKKDKNGNLVDENGNPVDEEGKPIKTATKEDNSALVDLLTKQGEVLMAQTKALENLAAAMTNQKDEHALNQAVTKVISGLPRKQASQFVTQEKQAPGESNSVDEVILAKLKEIEEQVKKQSGAPSMYDAFTSPNLNK